MRCMGLYRSLGNMRIPCSLGESMIHHGHEIETSFVQLQDYIAQARVFCKVSVF